MAFERCADAEGDDGDARGVAQAHDRGDLLVSVRKHDDIGQRGIGHALAMSMLLADGVARDRALREVVRQAFDDGRNVCRGRAKTGGSVHDVPRRIDMP